MDETKPASGPDCLCNLAARLRTFAAARDWEQFHSPKNLVMALSAEVGELTEHFQWLTEQESRTLPPSTLEEVRQELADVLNYLIRLADQLNIDLPAAANAKIDLNEERYPADRSRGTAKKYDEL